VTLKFAHVGLVVSDLDRMVEFYSLLGFKEFFRIRRDEPWIGEIVGRKGADIEIVHMATEGDECRIELLRYLEGPEYFGVSQRAHLSMWTDDLDKNLAKVGNSVCLSMLSERVVTIPDGPNKGMRVVYLLDPEGSVFELMERAK
jgi:hypothetical protein